MLANFQRAQVKSACVQMQSFAQAVEMFRITENGQCPTSVAELAKAGMISQAEPDPWNNDYGLECAGEAVTLRSGGPDGVLGSDDPPFAQSLAATAGVVDRDEIAALLQGARGPPRPSPRDQLELLA